ncbi:MAG: hypothetical protein KF744_06605 [Taibaiella sp.]|nr:hypothetical protein [Taibaiella sp.]
MKYTRYGTGILLLTIAVVYLFYALNVFPIPGTDSSSFLPPALTFGQGKGLVNPFFFASEITDLTGNRLYNYYVPFYTWFLGFWVAIIPGIKTIFVVGALLTTLALLLYRRIIINGTPASAGKLFTATILLSIPYLATYSLPTIGRPEQLTALLLLVLFVLYRNRARIGFWLYNPLLVAIFAVLLATQIIGFYFAFLVFLIIEFVQQGDAGRVLVVNVVRAIGVLLLFYLILEASPNGFRVTIEGILSVSPMIFMRTDTGIRSFVFFWLLSPFNIGFAVVFLACIRYWLLYMRQSLPAVAPINKFFIICLHIALVAGIFAFLLHRPPTVYNATQYIYVFVLFLLLNYDKYRGSKYHFFILPSLMFCFLAGSLLFLRTLVLFIDTKADGKDYAAARNKLAEVERKYGRCYTQLNLWPLYDDPYNVLTLEKRYMRPPTPTAHPGEIIVMPKTNEGTPQDVPASPELAEALDVYDTRNFFYIVHSGDIIVMPQANKDIPRSLLDRSEILEDWRTTNVRTFMHIPIARHPFGYSFVVLRVK